MKVEVQIKEQALDEMVARRNMTYADLAKKLGVNRIYLSNIKNNRLPSFRPSAKLRQKLMDTLGVQFDEVFDVITPKKKHIR